MKIPCLAVCQAGDSLLSKLNFPDLPVAREQELSVCIPNLKHMHLPSQLAQHVRNVHFGGNWTDSNLKEQLSDISWEQARKKVYGLNSILALVYHLHYFTRAITQVLEGGPLDAHDKFSFDHPEIQSQAEWEAFLGQLWKEAEHFGELVEALPDDQLTAIFSQEKYGTYLGNLLGLIEHHHYHLGQIVVIKKIVQAG